MDVLVEMTRKLGAAVQKDERYLAFNEARIAKDEDKELGEIIGKINLVGLSYQQEAQKGDLANQGKLQAYEDEYNKLANEAMLNPKMTAFQQAGQAIDDMMKYLVGILSLCVEGEDPETCEPESEEHHCGGECGSCGGC